MEFVSIKLSCVVMIESNFVSSINKSIYVNIVERLVTSALFYLKNDTNH